ncbi:hypothetical protein AC1031_008686 [Aphanomyces cochlioides]|nr:hypothetical protein AC1031_008686 [Aphanomyces cochlioides]
MKTTPAAWRSLADGVEIGRNESAVACRVLNGCDETKCRVEMAADSGRPFSPEARDLSLGKEKLCTAQKDANRESHLMALIKLTLVVVTTSNNHRCARPRLIAQTVERRQKICSRNSVQVHWNA